MSAVAGAPPIAPGMGGQSEKQGMSQGRKVLYWFLGVWLGGIALRMPAPHQTVLMAF